jgi:hypothetical protein
MDHSIRFWDIRKSKACLSIFQGMSISLKLASDSFPGMQLTSDGLWVVAVNQRLELSLIDTFTFEKKLTSDKPVYQKYLIQKPIQIDIQPIRLTKHPLIVIPARKRGTIIYDLWKQTIQKTLNGHLTLNACAKWNTWSKLLYTGGKDPGLLQWHCVKSKIHEPTDTWSDIE